MISLLLLSVLMITVSADEPVSIASAVTAYAPLASASASASDFVIFTPIHCDTSEMPSCSAPPSSLEICLSSVFSEIEIGIASIIATLQANEGNIQQEMHHEHTLLHSEISWVRLVETIASEVESAVFIDYQAVEQQEVNLHLELEYVSYLYAKEVVYIQELQAAIEVIIEQEQEIVIEYHKIQGEKWSLYEAISAIVYEKVVIQQEQAEIQQVIVELNAQIALVYEKIEQLYKRQSWLLSWENKLSVDIHALESDIVEFRVVEEDLYYRELSLYIEQAYFEVKVEYIQGCLESMHFELSILQEEYVELYAYLRELRSVQSSVSSEVSVFVYAYEEFTCEDSLLYYEACSATSHHPIIDVATGVASAVAPATEFEVVAPATTASEVEQYYAEEPEEEEEW